MSSLTRIPKEISMDQRLTPRQKYTQHQHRPSVVGPNKNTAMNVLIGFLLLVPFLATDAWVVPKSTLRSQTPMSARLAPKESRVLVVSGPRTRNSILQESTTSSTNSESLFSFSLFATLEDNKSEEEQTSTPAPRRTRRIDNILDKYEVTGGACQTIPVLESSLKREQE